MRIISGSLKGRSILVPKNFKGRPTTDFAREGLFNVLGNIMEIEGASVLDLFAGTGAFSIECLSRGAANSIAVELNSLHVKFIQQNYTHLGIVGGSTVRQDVFRFLDSCKLSFDLVFADPPYDLKNIEALPETVFNAGVVKPGGLFILEHGKRTQPAAHEFFLEKRIYSNVCFSFYRAAD